MGCHFCVAEGPQGSARIGVYMNLYEFLLQYRDSGRLPMHMPGHKRQPPFSMEDPYGLDVTEVEGTDNLHHPEGRIRRLMDQMRKMYGTRESYLLVNGSTCGILAAMSACCQKGDKVLVARNCHRSVYHGIYLLGLEPVYLQPETDPQTGAALQCPPEEVEKALETHENAACVILTSPTYEGVVSEVGKIAEIVHRYQIPLVVDEAHGAHLNWMRGWKTAMEEGADLVIESLHKTLPALTQTAVLHRCSDRVVAEKIRRYLDIYETSSPSYVLMASVAQCMDWLEQEGKPAFCAYVERLERFYEGAKQWRHLSLWHHRLKEPGKLVIYTGKADISATELAERLRNSYNIEIEMVAAEYVLAMTTVADTDASLERLMQALSDMDETLSESEPHMHETGSVLPQKKYSSYEAMNGPWEEVPIEKACGRVSAEYIMVYPPGIPFVVPGEMIDLHVLGQISEAKEKRLNLTGTADDRVSNLRVLKE